MSIRSHQGVIDFFSCLVYREVSILLLECNTCVSHLDYVSVAHYLEYILCILELGPLKLDLRDIQCLFLVNHLYLIKK